MTYIVIDHDSYQTDTAPQIARAQAALREAGLDQAPVITSPLASLEEVDQYGDPESYANGHILFAE